MAGVFCLWVEKEFFEPNLYVYDAYPGGIGFSEPLYHAYDALLAQTRELIELVHARTDALPALDRRVKRASGRRKLRWQSLLSFVPQTFRWPGSRMSSNPSNVNRISADRFSRLKALQRPASLPQTKFATMPPEVSLKSCQIARPMRQDPTDLRHCSAPPFAATHMANTYHCFRFTANMLRAIPIPARSTC